jgi:hypothetical protein
MSTIIRGIRMTNEMPDDGLSPQTHRRGVLIGGGRKTAVPKSAF